ncbi:MAG: NRDE family protein [Porticoccaceae bacterium]
MKKTKSYTKVMCLLSIAYQSKPETSLVVISNRDEFYQRATLPMHWWSANDILAGLDQQAGGTWLGLTRTGRFAAVTNFRDLHAGNKSRTNLQSRGELVTEFLSSKQDSVRWANSKSRELLNYNPFNLVIFDGENLVYLNNLDNTVKALQPGIYGLSNHFINSPWPKVDHARHALDSLIRNKPMNQSAMPFLLKALSSQKVYEANLLPDTGISQEMESLLSSPFIVSQGYGTRASTALIISSSGNVIAAEQSFENGTHCQLSEFAFEILR